MPIKCKQLNWIVEFINFERLLCFSLVGRICVCTSLSDRGRSAHALATQRERSISLIKCVKSLKSKSLEYILLHTIVMTQWSYLHLQRLKLTLDISLLYFLLSNVLPCDDRFDDLCTPLYVKCLKIQKMRKKIQKFRGILEYFWVF